MFWTSRLDTYILCSEYICYIFDAEDISRALEDNRHLGGLHLKIRLFDNTDMHLPNPIHLPPRYVLASILCSFGGFLFGYGSHSYYLLSIPS